MKLKNTGTPEWVITVDKFGTIHVKYDISLDNKDKLTKAMKGYFAKNGKLYRRTI